MKVRISINSLAALIGVWFIIAPWVVNFSDDKSALWTSVIIGALQLITSLLGFSGSGWSSWQNWISLLSGVWFIIFPFVYTLKTEEIWASVVLGAVTVIIGLWSLSLKE
jgi:sulfite exporter TauE/SafE